MIETQGLEEPFLQFFAEDDEVFREENKKAMAIVKRSMSVR